MRTHTKQRERGAVLPMVGLMLAVLLGMAGLALPALPRNSNCGVLWTPSMGCNISMQA